MRMILKNVDLSFLSKKKKYFKDIISGVNEFGGGYYPVTAGSETTKNGNVIQTTLNVLPLKYKLEQGHTYLFGFKANRLYTLLKTSNSYNTNGVMFASIDNITSAVVKVVKDSTSGKSNFNTHPYLYFGQPQDATNDVTYELYLYDITGEDASKFESFTFEQLKYGTISVYE